MSAIAWNGGVAWNGDVLWAQGVGEVVDLSAAAVVLRAIMAGAAAGAVPSLQATPVNLVAQLPGVAAAAEGGGSGGGGPVVWPVGPVGLSHTMIVSAQGPYGVGFSPTLYLQDRDVYAVDFDKECLDAMGDQAGVLLAVEALDPGILVTSRLNLGDAVPSGLVLVAVDSATAPGTYRVHVQISTVGGRERSAIFAVQVVS
jgi:hypothetical protein